VTDTKSPSNIAHHSAVVGILLTAFGFISEPFILNLLPDKYSTVIKLIGGVLVAFGITKQVQQNTQVTVASTAAVVKAVTNAPVDLAPNPAIQAARENPKVF
jgi:hypothetical protein